MSGGAWKRWIDSMSEGRTAFREVAAATRAPARTSFTADRVAFLGESPDLESRSRQHSHERSASPKLWADAWLLAFAEGAGGTIVTFDRPLAARTPQTILLEQQRRPHDQPGRFKSKRRRCSLRASRSVRPAR